MVISYQIELRNFANSSTECSSHYQGESESEKYEQTLLFTQVKKKKNIKNEIECQKYTNKVGMIQNDRDHW